MEATTENRIKSIIQSAWNYYGDDYMGSEDSGNACDVVECICDANRFETYASREIVQIDNKTSPDIVQIWNALELKEKIKLVMSSQGATKLKGKQCKNCGSNKNCLWRKTIGE